MLEHIWTHGFMDRQSCRKWNHHTHTNSTFCCLIFTTNGYDDDDKTQRVRIIENWTFVLLCAIWKFYTLYDHSWTCSNNIKVNTIYSVTILHPRCFWSVVAAYLLSENSTFSRMIELSGSNRSTKCISIYFFIEQSKLLKSTVDFCTW